MESPRKKELGIINPEYGQGKWQQTVLSAILEEDDNGAQVTFETGFLKGKDRDNNTFWIFRREGDNYYATNSRKDQIKTSEIDKFNAQRYLEKYLGALDVAEADLVREALRTRHEEDMVPYTKAFWDGKRIEEGTRAALTVIDPTAKIRTAD